MLAALPVDPKGFSGKGSAALGIARRKGCCGRSSGLTFDPLGLAPPQGGLVRVGSPCGSSLARAGCREGVIRQEGDREIFFPSQGQIQFNGLVPVG